MILFRIDFGTVNLDSFSRVMFPAPSRSSRVKMIAQSDETVKVLLRLHNEGLITESTPTAGPAEHLLPDLFNSPYVGQPM